MGRPKGTHGVCVCRETAPAHILETCFAGEVTIVQSMTNGALTQGLEAANSMPWQAFSGVTLAICIAMLLMSDVPGLVPVSLFPEELKSTFKYFDMASRIRSRKPRLSRFSGSKSMFAHALCNSS